MPFPMPESPVPVLSRRSVLSALSAWVLSGCGGGESEEVAAQELVFFPVYGQSWALGFEAVPALSTTQRYNSLMLSTGVVPQALDQSAPQPAQALVPLVERSFVGTAGFPKMVGGETPAAGQAEMVQQMLRADPQAGNRAARYQVLSSAMGEGGRRIEALSRGTVYYERLLDQVRQALSLARSAGLAFSVPAVAWVQNTADTGFEVDGGTAAYPGLLHRLQQDLDADVRRLTDQEQAVHLLNWQMFPDGQAVNSAGRVYARHVLATDASAQLHCCGPSYHLDQVTDQPGSVHLTAVSSKWLGAYLGLVYHRVVVQRQQWQPLRPLSVTVSGDRIVLKLHVPVAPLVFDVDRVALAQHFGFSVVAADGVTELPLISVQLQQPDRVILQLSATPPAGSLLRYASQGDRQGRRSGIRGNLRDSQGDRIVFDPQGLRLPMHNWCVCFEEPIHAAASN